MNWLRNISIAAVVVLVAFAIWAAGPPPGTYIVPAFMTTNNARVIGTNGVGVSSNINVSVVPSIGTYLIDGIGLQTASTNTIIATLTTTDNTTNNIYTFTPLNNSCTRVMANIVGYNATSSASYGKIATFKNAAGTVTQIGITATIGQAEEDGAYESLINVTGATTVRIQVAGNTGRTVNWIAYIQLIYVQ